MERKAVTNKKINDKKKVDKKTIDKKNIKTIKKVIKKEPINKLDTKKKNVKKQNEIKTSIKQPKQNKKTNIIKISKKANDIKIKEKAYEKINEKDIPLKNKKTNKRGIKLVVAFFLIGILVCCIYLILTLDTFDVKSYDVSGTNKYSNEEVLKSLALNQNENIFIQLFKIKSKNKINLPYIDNFHLSIKLPDKLLINLEDRKSAYMVYDKDNNKYYKLSEDGYILEESNIDKRDNKELLLYGIIFNNQVVLGEKINELDLVKIKLYKKIEVEYIKSGINSVITKVNFENSLTTITLDDKLNVVLPNDTNLKYNINFLKPIIEKLGKDSAGVIDMTKTNPTFSGF